MTRAQKLCLGTWMLAFAVGTTTHTLDLLQHGWLPYRFAPLPLNAFWTALTFIDPLVIVLLALRRNAGLALGLAVIVVDVIVNSYVSYGVGVAGLGWALQSQTLFLGFALGSVAFLWDRPGRAG